MKTLALLLVCLSTLLVVPLAAAADPLVVVCTLTDLGWLAERVGGPDAEVSVLCPGEYDPHFLPARPSLARQMGKADLLCYNGLDLEVGWLPVLLDKARNPRIRPGQPGDLDCSLALDQILEVPQGQVSRAQGDVHPQGNPHYLMDPRNGLRVAEFMAERMARLRPAAAADFRRRAAELAAEFSPRIAALNAMAAPVRARALVQYTKQWEYLFDWLDLELLGSIEHRPGISPSPRHVDELINRARQAGVREVIAAPWNHLEVAAKAAGRLEANFVVLPAAVGSLPGADSYPALFDLILQRLLDGAGK